MLSRSTLKAELKGIRARMKTPQYERAELELIDRLIEDDRREKAWRQIKDRAPAFPAQELFKVLCTAWQGAQTAHRLRAWAEWRLEMKQGLNYALSGPAHNQDPAAIIELLGYALTETRARFGNFKYVDVDEAPAKINFSQKDGKLTAEQRLFIQILVNYFTRNLEQPLYNTVAALAEIAFPELENQHLTAEDVSYAVKATTERGRSKRPR
jgi:hypothetical protein